MLPNQEIVQKTADFVRETLAGAEGGHDWWHIYRIWQTARHIAASEQVDLLVVELGALLHDIADSKFYDGDEEIGPQTAATFLRSLEVAEETVLHVENIIRFISFKGGNFEQTFTSPELQVVQDADRLDALGAMGIARTFSYGGFKGRELYNPNIAPNLHMTKEEYKNCTSPSINHFYEKLLLLKDRMNTTTGKRIAEQRHAFMESYLEQFYAEWEGTR